jgi:hypothetical protein
MGKRFGISAVAAVVILMTGCSSDQASAPGYGTMTVRMTDDPGDFDQVNLVITQVSARVEDFDTDTTDVDDDGEWIVLENDPDTFDLMTLQNGHFATIGSALVPAGHYTEVRLKLGSGSNVVVDGVTHPLVVPSGMQSGLKLKGSFDVPAGGVLDISLDFDAGRSIFQTGTGQYMLKPVIKILAARIAGGITGNLLPAGVNATIYAMQLPDTAGSSRAAADGHFTLAVLSAGNYDLAVRPDSGYRDTTLFGVSVEAGLMKDVGTIQLTPLQ